MCVHSPKKRKEVNMSVLVMKWKVNVGERFGFFKAVIVEIAVNPSYLT